MRVAVTIAFVPTGVNVYHVAARYDAEPGVSPRAVFLSTVLSVGAISLVPTLLGWRTRPDRRRSGPRTEKPRSQT